MTPEEIPCGTCGIHHGNRDFVPVCLEALKARVGEVESLLEHILNGFEVQGHPGQSCHRSSWIPDETLASWRRTTFRNRT